MRCTTKTTLTLTTLTTLTLVAAGLLAACGDKPATGTGGGETPPAETAVSMPDGLFVDAAPDGAVDIGAAKGTAKEGDEIVVSGRIGGTHDPFVGSRASFTLASAGAMKACDERPGDGCKTPWDYCCETPEDILHNTATIQVVGADGRPLKTGLQGQGGLEPLKTVTIKGTVGPRASDEVLIVNASAIHVQ